uniref:Uncharacterized protein n=1 Tax=Setaria italica TaxID=4555 RepID=K3YDH3_SETIT
MAPPPRRPGLRPPLPQVPRTTAHDRLHPRRRGRTPSGIWLRASSPPPPPPSARAYPRTASVSTSWTDATAANRRSSYGTPSPTFTRRCACRRRSGWTPSTSPPPSSATPRDATTSAATAARSAWCSSASTTRRVRGPRPPSLRLRVRTTGGFSRRHLPPWWGARSTSGAQGGLSCTSSATRWSSWPTSTSRRSSPSRPAERSSCRRRTGGSASRLCTAAPAPAT